MQLISQSGIGLIWLNFPIRDHFDLHQGWPLTGELTVVEKKNENLSPYVKATVLLTKTLPGNRRNTLATCCLDAGADFRVETIRCSLT